MNYPKITIVTPNYNLGQFLEQTILSVLNQDYPNLEYIIIDGGSTDNSLKIIKKYEDKLTYWVSEPDSGLYHAIQKGFDKSTGEIMGWLNSDDMLHPNSLFYINQLFSQFSEIEWIQGRPSFFDKNGGITNVAPIRRWSKYDFYIGDYQWIQQESTFWKKSLWERSGSYLNTNLKLTGDFDLWLRFFDFAELYSTSVILAGFRMRGKGQLSQKYYDKYIIGTEQQLQLKLATFTFPEQLRISFYKLIFIIFKLLKALKIFNHIAVASFILPTFFGATPILFWDIHSQKFIKQNRV
jgi:glycosyltransferase involved in cell wall biosynthesis